MRSIAGGCLILALLSSWALTQEGQARFWGGYDDISRARDFADHASIPGLAIATQRQVLNTCYRLFYFAPDIEFLLDTAENQASVAASCERLAGDAGARNPMFSFAFMVQSLAAANLGHADIFSQAIIRSVTAAPRELWIAIPRVDVAEANFSLLSATAANAHQSDLRLLASNYVGIGKLAAFYVRDESAQERITAVVETMPGVEQRTFLHRVQAMVDSQ